MALIRLHHGLACQAAGQGVRWILASLAVLNGSETLPGSHEIESLPVELLLLTRSGSDSWLRFLRQCRIPFEHIDESDVAEFALKSVSTILLVDIRCEERQLRELRRRLRSLVGRRPFVIALLPGVAGEGGEADLDAAYQLGAADFLLSDTPPDTVRQKLKFIGRAISVPQDQPMMGRAPASGQPAWIWHLEDGRVEISRNFSALLGQRHEPVARPSRDLLKLVHKADRHLLIKALGQVRDGLSPETIRHRMVTPEGEVLSLIHTLERVDGEGVIIRGTLELLADQEDHQLPQDPVTGLAGLAAFERKVKRLLDVWAQSQQRNRFAVILINLDRFRNIVATYGRKTAEEILRQAGQRLKGIVQDIAVSRILSARTRGGRRLAVPYLAHLSGDEFAVVIPGGVRRHDVRSIAARLLVAFDTHFDVPKEPGADKPVFLTASIGIAFPSPTANTVDTLLRDAHAALGEAKKSPSSSIELHSASVAAIAFEKMELEHRLRHAMETRELQVHYQPQVEIATGEIIGVEALVRWMHPELGLIHPEAFIEIAEKAGLTRDLGYWVLEASMGELRDMEEKGLPPIKLAVNLSADIFHHQGVANQVLKIAKRTGFDVDRLALEVTESLILEDPEAALTTMIELRRQGIKLALDDFGTGYSSLSYLKTLPFDFLKIDQTFIEDLIDEQADLTVLRGIIAMAKTLGMAVIAEGVENERQLDRLTEEGADLYQGFLCATPLPASELKALFDRTAKSPVPR